jgi:hypothetical protein
MLDATKLTSASDVSKLLQQLGAKPSYFSLSSRYRDIATATLEKGNGEEIIYLLRRFIPQPDRFFLLQELIVKESDRLDNITNQYIGDPERFWQLCDANNTLIPDDLTKNSGAKIRITLPEGIPGNSNA